MEAQWIHLQNNSSSLSSGNPAEERVEISQRIRPENLLWDCFSWWCQEQHHTFSQAWLSKHKLKNNKILGKVNNTGEESEWGLQGLQSTQRTTGNKGMLWAGGAVSSRGEHTISVQWGGLKTQSLVEIYKLGQLCFWNIYACTHIQACNKKNEEEAINLKDSEEGVWEGLVRKGEGGNDVLLYNLKKKDNKHTRLPQLCCASLPR